jgi:hypothetical protein
MLLFGIATAGTVTLTGSCATKSFEGGDMHFNLSNSGNDTAYNLVITPFLKNVRLLVPFYTVSSLGPNSNVTLDVDVNGITESGVSTGYFLTSYQQGTDVFSAVFPCLYTLGTTTSSQVLISQKNTVSSTGNATVTVSVFNAGLDQEQVNVSLMLPPVFKYTGVKSYLLEVGPSSTTNATFNLFISPSTQGSYSVAASASYFDGNLSHATLSTFVIAAPTPSTGSLANIVMYAAFAVVIVVFALVIFSMMRRRGKQEPVPVPA